GLLTWAATRPVLESKRLPELIISQVRYIGEPSTWCRLAPLAEKDEIVVFGRVWRRGRGARAGSAGEGGVGATAGGRGAPGAGRGAGRAEWPVAAAAAQGVSGQPVTEQGVRGRAGAGRRGRQGRERPARDQQVRERAPAGPAQGQRVRGPAEPPGTR